MYWLIEEEDQLEFLLNSGYKEVFIEIIPYNDRVHPRINEISLIYIRPGLTQLKVICYALTIVRP